MIFGGESSGKSLDSVELFSPDGECLRGHASMPEDRTFSTVTLFDGKYFVCGGKKGKEVLKTCVTYEWEKDEWSTNVPEMPIDR